MEIVQGVDFHDFRILGNYEFFFTGLADKTGTATTLPSATCIKFSNSLDKSKVH